MTKLERKLKATLRRLALAPESKVLIGVSGGADSMALLDAMSRLRVKEKWLGEIYSAHVNHLLRGAESDADQKAVEAWVADWTQNHKLSLPTVAMTLDVAAQARETRQNLEKVARETRYDFFQETAQSYQIPLVFTAHTFDDQSETLMMRWLRGTGAGGLQGIHERRPLCQDVELIRPLLNVTRAEVLEHCEHYGLAYRTDSSNFSEDYTRNRIRHQLLPLLREFNPQFDTALQHSAALWQADANYLDAQASLLSATADMGAHLALYELADAHPVLRQRVLRAWLAGRVQLTATHCQALEQLILSGQSGRTIQLPKGWRVTREFGALTLWHVREPGQFAPAPVTLMAGEPQKFGLYEFVLHPPGEDVRKRRCIGQAVVLPEAVAQGLWLRVRQSGDAYVPVGRTTPVKLKTLMQRKRIPPTQRASHPLLVAATGEIVWSPDLPQAAAFQVNPDEERCVWVSVT